MLYKGILAEHSTLENIVQRARHYERTIASMKAGHGPEKQPGLGISMPIESGQ